MGIAELDAALATPERLAVLAKAQAVRERREQIERSLEAGELALAEVIAIEASSSDDDEVLIVTTTKVLPLLEAVPHMGKVTSRRLLARLDIEESVIVAGLETTDIDALLEGIEELRDG